MGQKCCATIALNFPKIAYHNFFKAKYLLVRRTSWKARISVVGMRGKTVSRNYRNWTIRSNCSGSCAIIGLTCCIPPIPGEICGVGMRNNPTFPSAGMDSEPNILLRILSTESMAVGKKSVVWRRFLFVLRSLAQWRECAVYREIDHGTSYRFPAPVGSMFCFCRAVQFFVQCLLFSSCWWRYNFITGITGWLLRPYEVAAWR